MRLTSLGLAAVIAIVALAFGLHLAGAQFGEAAGQPHLVVPIGGSNSTEITLINYDFNESVTFVVASPKFKPDNASDANYTLPVAVVTPMSGTIPPRSDLKVNLTVYVPYFNSKAGVSWSGILEFIETSNSASGSSGAVVRGGLAKIVGVLAVKPALPFFYISVGIAVVAIAAAIALLLRTQKLRTVLAAVTRAPAPSRAAARGRRRVSARPRAHRRRRAAPRRSRTVRTARRRSARRSTTRSARSTTRRRRR